MADKRGTGLLMVWIDIPASMEEDFNNWYNEEHLDALRLFPGVLGAARYEAVSGGPKHLAMYELENPEVWDSAPFKQAQKEYLKNSPWSQRINPRANAANFVQNIYEMIYPDHLTTESANADFAPVLQIGRMAIAPEHDEEWNQWYSGVFVPNFEKVPGCIRGRRWRAYQGSPRYAVMYELENDKVSQSPEWLKQRDINPDNGKMRDLITHASGSPGIWKRTV